MGTRINKTIGYGLTDVQVEDCRITDPRINADSFLLRGYVEHDEDHLSYGQWLKQRMTGDDMDDLDLILDAQNLEAVGAKDAYSTVTHKAEYALPEVLMVRPAGFPSWHRHDNIIDFEEEGIRRAEIESRVEPTLGGIHPWNGLHMDVRTGKKIEGTLVNAWRRVVNAGDEEDKPLLDRLAQALGYADHAEAERFVAPFVPFEVRRICEWGGLFTSPDVVLQLRPMLYVYWA